MNRPIIMGNWKMNNTLAESKELVRQLGMLAAGSEVEVVVCPPVTALATVAGILPDSMQLGAQNVHPASHGAFTGEISVSMVKDVGVRYVLVGHSERRTLLGEDDDYISQKVYSIVQGGLVPVLCVGESLAERQAGEGSSVVLEQLRRGLEKLDVSTSPEVVVAYEPLWAIGTGQAASAEDARQMISTIKDNLPSGLRARVLYGGSVSPDNIADYMAVLAIDGALVGGVSLTAEAFAEVVRITRETKESL